MTQVSEALGRKIREIRKNRRCTLEELGQAVHKSKATLSKYETGDIVIDVETLYEIARALRVSVFSLMNLPVEECCAEPPAPDMRGRDVFASPLLYLYYYGGEERAVHRSVIERDADGCGAKLYHEVSSFDDYCLCSKVYKGQVQEYSFYTRLPFENEFCRLDRIMMIFPSMLNGDEPREPARQREGSRREPRNGGGQALPHHAPGLARGDTPRAPHQLFHHRPRLRGRGVARSPAPQHVRRASLRGGFL